MTPDRCTRCPDLVASRSRIIPGTWIADTPSPNPIMYIGEAPGKSEDRRGEPFIGMTGQEVREALWRVGLTSRIYLTNIVKCHPKDDRDPTPDEIGNCLEWLKREIAAIDPVFIVTAGRFSTRWALGRDDFTMEMVSGIPYHSPVVDCPVLPMIHPAAGFHSQRNMSMVMNAFKVAGDMEAMVRELPERSKGVYWKTGGGISIDGVLDQKPDVIAMDTESGPDGTWSVQVSHKPGQGIMIPTTDTDGIRKLGMYITQNDPLVVFHSALYDLPVLRSLNITPTRIHDTMVMSYLLQDEPLGLKPLAWRHANVKMDNYVEIISQARKSKAMAYLRDVAERKWPTPEPVLVYEKGLPRIKQPQGIGKKAKRIIGDVEKGKTLKDGTPVDPRKRWHQIKLDEGRGGVERELGEMPDGYLADVDPDKAMAYGCCDADMTLTVYWELLDRIKSEALMPLLDVEWGVTRFVDWMQEGGMPVDVDQFARISRELQQGMDDIELEIIKETGHTIQLSSHQQVSDLLYNKLDLRRYLPKKRSKKMGKTMTGDAVLAQIEHHHPVVKMIRDRRKLEKLKNTYADGVPRHVTEDGRVHPDIRTTNTDTGRLSMADPNLMAQPKRDKVWAKKIRKGFVAPDGYVFVSMDYSQIELRLTAEEANEASMIRAFVEGIDLHALTASEMFDVHINQVNKLTQRLPAKTINFGIIYGISAIGLYRNMVTVEGCEHWTEGLAQTYIDKYFDRRPGIKDYINDTISMARRYGKVWDWSGRIRRIPGARLKNEYYRAEAERQACNARIQMGAQSIIKKAMADLVPVYDGWRQMGWDLSPAIQIHDDLVSIVPVDLLDTFIPVQKAIMEAAKPLKTGTRVDVEWGFNWGEMMDWE